VALINSGMGAGLLFLNDIKSIEGDRKLGLQSMTVALGARKTLTVSFLIIGICEIALFILALLGGHLWATAFILLALVVPIHSQIQLYREPNHENFKRYMLASNGFAVLLQLLGAFLAGGYLG
jgi:chlorophyll synthase